MIKVLKSLSQAWKVKLFAKLQTCKIGKVKQIISIKSQKQPWRGALMKRCSENIQHAEVWFATLLKSYFSMSVLP